MAKEISQTDIKNVLLKDVSISPEWTDTKNTFVWKYFGKIMLEFKGKRWCYNSSRIFCTECLVIAKKKSKSEADLFDSFSSDIKSFSSKTSTGNLTKHLSSDHNIVETAKVTNKSLQTIQMFFNPVSRKESDKLTDAKRKRNLVIDLVLLCCRDLLPFDIVSREGWLDFCKKYDIIADSSDMPHPTTISRCLDFVYQHCKAEVIKAIENQSPKDVSTTNDMWTDKHRRRPYNTVTLHYLDDNFNDINLTLKTKYFPKRHTGANILSELERVLEEFRLQDKNVYMVTDAARNVRKACELGNYENPLCKGHGMHNLVYTDGIKKTEDVKDITVKVRNIVKALRYKTSDFNKISKEYVDVLNSMAELGELDQYFDDDYEDDLESDDESYDEYSANPSNRLKSLKLDVVTRWYSTLFMMESVKLRGRVAINLVLQTYDKDDLCLSQYEFKLIEALCSFWKNFEKISGMLSGETYSTINMACVFRSELMSLLEDDVGDLSEIAELKRNMRLNFDTRFPISELIVVASLLDPRCQNLMDITTFLKENGTTAFQLLKKWVTECNSPLSSDKTSEKTEETNFVEELVEKHSSLKYVSHTIRSEAELDGEIYLLLSLGGNVKFDNIRMFWKTYSKQLPNLSVLARKILCIPMTSTPSERNFSIAGLIVNLRRSSLLPCNLDKIIFIHNNYNFCKNIALQTLKIENLKLDEACIDNDK